MLLTANYRTVHTWYSDEALHIGGLYIPVAKLIAFVLAMALSGALWAFLHTTDLGKATSMPNCARRCWNRPITALFPGL